jgi:hypothetical protein
MLYNDRLRLNHNILHDPPYNSPDMGSESREHRTDRERSRSPGRREDREHRKSSKHDDKHRDDKERLRRSRKDHSDAEEEERRHKRRKERGEDEEDDRERRKKEKRKDKEREKHDRKKEKRKEGSLKVVDDDNDEDMWVEKDIDVEVSIHARLDGVFQAERLYSAERRLDHSYRRVLATEEQRFLQPRQRNSSTCHRRRNPYGLGSP